jgi:hypothetical protein
MHVEVFLGPKRSPSAFESAFPEQNVHGKRVLISMRCKVPAWGAATTSEHCVMASSLSLRCSASKRPLARQVRTACLLSVDGGLFVVVAVGVGPQRLALHSRV